MTSRPISIVWFRNDLRLHDNAALSAACGDGGPVLGLYVLDEESAGCRPLGGAARWWLHHALASLADALEKTGIPLVLKRGPALKTVEAFAQETNAGALYWNRRYDAAGIAVDTGLKSALVASGHKVESFPGSLLVEPIEVLTGRDTAYRVFGAFWRAAEGRISDATPLPAPEAARGAKATAPSGDNLEDWDLLPKSPDWAGGIRACWSPGETSARRKLADFIDGALEGYGVNRDLPGRNGTSLLSPHLRFGEISPRTVWAAVRKAIDKDDRLRADGEKFLAELGWREFSHYLLHHFPEMETNNFDPAFDGFDWRDDALQLECWRHGRTGYPIVDAGMRQLWDTGYMHNRVRMIVASFLTKHLRLHWHHGEAWFWDTLVDADLANNVANWQWVAGTGADAAPYFRIFNPILQGEKFDAEGEYVRHWVPELSGLPDKVLHKPWEASASVLSAAGVALGDNYPSLIVDHAEARATALAAFRSLKEG